MSSVTSSDSIIAEIWELRDKRVDDWLFMSSIWPTLIICASYVYLVKVWGPDFMRDRKPMDVRKTLIVYNAFQVVFSAWLVYEAAVNGWLHYDLRCEPVDYSLSPSALKMAAVSWWYYFSKFTEFPDTLFFIARKKFDHVSNLHVIHHGLMPLFVWTTVRWVPGGHETFGGLCNAFVHVFMYLYYLLAAVGGLQKYLWWKKYLTTMQMVQFFTVLLHSLQIFVWNECGYPWQFSALTAFHMILFFVMFMDFYTKTYRQKISQKTD